MRVHVSVHVLPTDLVPPTFLQEPPVTLSGSSETQGLVWTGRANGSDQLGQLYSSPWRFTGPFHTLNWAKREFGQVVT